MSHQIPYCNLERFTIIEGAKGDGRYEWSVSVFRVRETQVYRRVHSGLVSPEGSDFIVERGDLGRDPWWSEM